jgi:hypothetical protein
MSALLLAATIGMPMVWAQRADRAERSRAAVERMTVPARTSDSTRDAVRARVQNGRSAIAGKSLTSRDATDPVATQRRQAPGVTQVNLFDLSREAYFVLTEAMPAGTIVQFFLALPHSQSDTEWELAFEARQAGEELPVGFSFYLPAIKTLGDFWKSGATTYTVVVTRPGEAESYSSFDFGTKGYVRTAVDMPNILPRIESWREFVNGDGNTIVEIKGLFQTGMTTYVVFEDQVAPASAINVIDANTIHVTLNALPNFDLTSMLSYQLTVGQDEWSDVMPFRHTPR